MVGTCMDNIYTDTLWAVRVLHLLCYPPSTHTHRTDNMRVLHLLSSVHPPTPTEPDACLLLHGGPDLGRVNP